MRWALWISRVPWLRWRLMRLGELGGFVTQADYERTWVFWNGGKSVLVLRWR